MTLIPLKYPLTGWPLRIMIAEDLPAPVYPQNNTMLSPRSEDLMIYLALLIAFLTISISRGTVSSESSFNRLELLASI
jgi:hypothetical protein